MIIVFYFLLTTIDHSVGLHILMYVYTRVAADLRYGLL